MSGPVLFAVALSALLLQRYRIRRHQPPREMWILNLLTEVGFVWYSVQHHQPWILAMSVLYTLSYLDNLRLWRLSRPVEERVRGRALFEQPSVRP